MANVKHLFFGTEESKTSDTDLECFATSDGILICIEDERQVSTFVVLDVYTAIELYEHLGRQIELINPPKK